MNMGMEGRKDNIFSLLCHFVHCVQKMQGVEHNQNIAVFQVPALLENRKNNTILSRKNYHLGLIQIDRSCP